MHSRAIYGDQWELHHGKVVTLEGVRCRIHVDTYTARYPYVQEVISVSARPLSKISTRYREIRRQLGDDWATDVLDSDIEVQCDILQQLGVS